MRIIRSIETSRYGQTYSITSNHVPQVIRGSWLKEKGEDTERLVQYVTKRKLSKRIKGEKGRARGLENDTELEKAHCVAYVRWMVIF